MKIKELLEEISNGRGVKKEAVTENQSGNEKKYCHVAFFNGKSRAIVTLPYEETPRGSYPCQVPYTACTRELEEFSVECHTQGPLILDRFMKTSRIPSYWKEMLSIKIKLTRGLKTFPFGKRGDSGYLLEERAKSLLPLELRKELDQKEADCGTRLAFLNGFLVGLPPEYYRCLESKEQGLLF